MQSFNQNLYKISELLSDNEYHDGTSIGNQLKITRAAVWKAIKKLEAYGIDLKSVKGKGYLLENPLILLNAKKIKSLLNNKSIKLEVLEKIDSTNDYVKKYIPNNKELKICIAEYMTKGKGRLHRKWHAPFGKNIYFSLLYPFQKDISELSGLSLVVSLAVCHAIELAVKINQKLSVKWPNDVLVNKYKLAGTLIEAQSESNGFCQVIIGIGINVNMMDADKKDISQPWTSLAKVTGEYIDRNILGSNLINVLDEYLANFKQHGLKYFIKEWQKRDCLLDQSVALMSDTHKFQGISAGVNDQGHLLLKINNKTIQAFSSGDTTLLK
jgi:BirA family biotin operon repressor/biotin-[acetyl-CoA-carboxylase] ligase